MTAKFKVGDRVKFTNDQGCVFKGKTITEIEPTKDGFRYYYTPSDSPWFAVRESQLSLEVSR